MLKHFNIKIDNPLVFMEQTTMKQFIQGDEKAKYEVLMQALNFKSLEQHFTVTEGNLMNMNETLKRYKDVELSRKREERNRAQEELKAVEHLRSRQEKIVELEKRVAWAEVQRYERDIEESQQEIQKLGETMETLQVSIEKDRESLKELEEEAEQFKQQLNGISNDLSLQMEEAKEVEKEMQAVIGPRDDADVKIREKTRQRAQLLRQAEANRQQIDRLNQEMAALTNNMSKKREIETLQGSVERFSEESKQLKDKIAEIEQGRAEWETRRTDVMARLTEITTDHKRVVNHVKAEEARLTSLASSRDDAINLYGPFWAKLQKSMKRERFQQPVFGPIGMYMHVREEYKEWIPALEMFLDRTLSSVVVARGTQDAQKVRRLIREVNVYKCNVIEVDYEGDLMMDRELMVDPQYLTFFNIVTFDNIIVKKAVVMQSSLERRVLCKDRYEVEKITGRGAIQSLPPNVHSFVLLNGDTVRVVKGRPSYISAFKKPSGYLQPDLEMVIKQTTDALNVEKERKRQMDGVLREITAERDGVVQTISRMDRELSSYRTRHSSLVKEMNRQQRKLDELIAEDDESELIALREQQQQAEEAVAATEAQVNEVDQEIMSLKAVRDEYEAQMTPLNERRDMVRRRIIDTQEKARLARERVDVEARRLKLETHMQKAEDGLKRLEVEKREKEAMVARKQEEVNASIEVLGESSRVRERLNKHSCEVELRQYREDLNTELQQLGVPDLDKLNRAYEEKQQSYKRCADEYEAVKEEGLEMERLDKRQRLSYNQLRSEAQQQICLRFTQFLSQRKAEGIVSIDHQTKEVALKVKMDSNHEVAASQVTNIRVLSGGEKSFVTLSLIMATAHIIESPFFIMDEFDVFMDEANRHVSLTTIIQTAREEKKQFIFITPHNLETVVKEMERDGKNSDIRIVTLADHQSGRQR